MVAEVPSKLGCYDLGTWDQSGMHKERLEHSSNGIRDFFFSWNGANNLIYQDGT